MRSGQKSVSCLPCAKRKVRCDKQQPCCHCKRRKYDTCEYPTPNLVHASPSGGSLQRTERLERYIRSLGGDPSEVDPPGDDASQTDHDRASSYDRRTPLIGKMGGMVSRSDGVNFINTPMWYSWSDANTPQSSRVLSDTPNSAASQSYSRNQPLSCFPTLLQCSDFSQHRSVCAEHLPVLHLDMLWAKFLDNVHPLVNMFFDWEVEPLIHKAAEGFLSLSNGEQSLICAITFITTLSLSQNECTTHLLDEKARLLNRYQQCVEGSLIISDFTTTSDLSTLQAFMLYLLAMRDRAHPAAIYSLTGLASRIAERLGLHRDGEILGLSVLRSEERRRMWWQLQYMEIAIARLVGSLSMMPFAAWDARMPANLEDSDFSPNMQALPSQRKGLTRISTCLWRYHILETNRATQMSRSDGPSTILLPHIPLAKKDLLIDKIESELGTRFLQHCEPLNPLHVSIQIGVRQFLLAARRTARLPALVNAKISEMSQQERDSYLGICTKILEYYILAHKTESLKGFQWSNDNYFNSSGFVYVILEAHHRFDKDEVVNLWSLIRDVYELHQELQTTDHRHELVAVAHIIVMAWQRYDNYTQQRRAERNESEVHVTPQWIVDIRHNFDIPFNDSPSMTDTTAHQPIPGLNGVMSEDFDFDLDMVDWSFLDKVS